MSVHNHHIVWVCVPTPSTEAFNKVFYSLTRSIVPMLLLTVLYVKGERYLKYGRDNNVYSLHVYIARYPRSLSGRAGFVIRSQV